MGLRRLFREQCQHRAATAGKMSGILAAAMIVEARTGLDICHSRRQCPGEVAAAPLPVKLSVRYRLAQALAAVDYSRITVMHSRDGNAHEECGLPVANDCQAGRLKSPSKPLAWSEIVHLCPGSLERS